MVSLSNIVGGASSANKVSNTRNDLNREAAFAMHRIVEVVSHTSTLNLVIDNSALHIHAFLDPTRDIDLDGFFDVDNDKDGLIDEDTAPPAPTFVAGDDDGDGEESEDWEDKVIIYIDLDNDLLKEEDPFPLDVNSPTGVDQFDKRTYTVASHVTLFQASITTNPDSRYSLLNVSLELTGDNGEVVTRTTAIRIGGAL